MNTAQPIHDHNDLVEKQEYSTGENLLGELSRVLVQRLRCSTCDSPQTIILFTPRGQESHHQDDEASN